MIHHELSKVKRGWKWILLWDFVIPISMVCLATYFLDKWLAIRALQYMVNFPFFGERFYYSPFFKTRFLPWFILWHRFLFGVPLLLLYSGASYRTARLPGPGRAFLRFWQSLLQHKWGKDKQVDPFPPTFNPLTPHMQKVIQAWQQVDPNAALVGFYKRFLSDLEQEQREEKETEKPSAYFNIVLTGEIRFRHIQVIGGSGSGKSASIIAPMLRQDAASGNIATLTINPKADLYLIKVMVDEVRKQGMNPPGGRVPTAIISFYRKESLAYDPLLFGDADALTKKIIGSSDIIHPFYKSVQETWLMSFFRVMKTEAKLVDRVTLKHLYRFLMRPKTLLERVQPLCQDDENIERLNILATAKPETLAGLASHIGQLVEDESLSHIFNNPKGRMLNLREVIQKGGNIFIDVDMSSKGPQARTLGRMIMMEIQLLAGQRQAGLESSDIGVQVYLDEFASFAYNGFIDLIDKCRSAKIGLLLSHQSLANLKRDNLSQSFKDEVVDNTYTKFFLLMKDETAEWASRQLGVRKVVKKSLSIGQMTDKTNVHGRDNQTVSFREEIEPYVQPSGFKALAKGYGYAQLETPTGGIVQGPIRLGYVRQSELCSDEDLQIFMRQAMDDHPLRPKNGSLIDDDFPKDEKSTKEIKGTPTGGASTKTPAKKDKPRKDAPDDKEDGKDDSENDAITFIRDH